MTKLLGIPFSTRTMEETVETLNEKMKQESSLFHVVTANPEIVMISQKKEAFKALLEKVDMVTPDGIGIIVGSKMIKQPIPERVAGYDLIHQLLQKRNKEGIKTRVFCVGAKEDVLKLAVRNLRQLYSEVEIVGYHHGYFEEGGTEEKTIVQQINQTAPDLLLVGLGSPRQEFFIHHHKEELNARIAIGCGGTFDVLSGQVKRAPAFFQKVGLEWFYRLLQQPSRLKRQWSIPLFLIKVIQSKKELK